MQLSDEQSRINREVGELKGRQQGIENLSSQVLDAVHKAIAEKQD